MRACVYFIVERGVCFLWTAIALKLSSLLQEGKCVCVCVSVINVACSTQHVVRDIAGAKGQNGGTQGGAVDIPTVTATSTNGDPLTVDIRQPGSKRPSVAHSTTGPQVQIQS